MTINSSSADDANRPPLQGSDPVEAAIERHRGAREDLQRAADAVDAAERASRQVEAEADAAFTAASAADGAAWADLLATRPDSVPGAVRLLRYVSASPASEVVEDTQDLLRQLAAAVEAAEAGGQADPGSANLQKLGGEPDPVFSAIEAHRAAFAEWDRFASVYDGMVPDDPGYADATGASGASSRHEIATFEALFSAEPTTLAGIKALAEYLVVAVRRASFDAEPSDGERALRTVSQALARLLGLRATDGAGRDWTAWAASHPGFVPYPAHAPVGLVALDLAIRGEAERLLMLAEEEIERRRQDYAGYPDPEVWPRVERDLRREMRMEALAVVASALPADDGAPDPARAAIAASRQAEAEMAAFGASAPERLTPEPRAREDALSAAQNATRATAWATVPTTRAGRIALVEYARFQIELFRAPDGWVENPEHLLAEILDAFEAAIKAERPECAAPSTAHPDAALFALGPTIGAIIAAHDAVPSECEEAYEKIDTLLMAETRRLAEMRACTLDGLVLKARFVERGADEELKDGIVADLLAIGGGK
jgi:hypothetical protein